VCLEDLGDFIKDTGRIDPRLDLTDLQQGGNDKFPARLRLRFAFDDQGNKSDDKSDSVISATRRLKTLTGDPFAIKSPTIRKETDKPEIEKALQSMDNQIRQVIDLLVPLSGTVNSPKPGLLHNSKHKPDSPKQDDPIKIIYERFILQLSDYFEEYMMDSETGLNPDQILGDFVGSAYVDQITDNFPHELIFLNSQQEILRIYSPANSTLPLDDLRIAEDLEPLLKTSDITGVDWELLLNNSLVVSAISSSLGSGFVLLLQ
jgi:hypothetical protein